MSTGFTEHFYNEVKESWVGKSVEVSYYTGTETKRELQTEVFMVSAVSFEKEFAAVKLSVVPQNSNLGHLGTINKVLHENSPVLEFFLRVGTGMYLEEIKGKKYPRGFDSLIINYTSCCGLRMGSFGYPLVGIKLV